MNHDKEPRGEAEGEGEEHLVPDHRHEPVLLDAVLEHLAPAPGEVVADCTAGRGGHSTALARAVRLNAPPPADAPYAGSVVGFDRDADNLAHARARVEAGGGRFEGVHASFATLPRWARLHEVRFDVVLADLGFSSNQMDDPERGFSFRQEGPLDMRFDPNDASPTAADLVATLGEAELADLIYRLGEEPLARKIARNLVRQRAVQPILTTSALADIVRSAYGPRARTSRTDPATRTFMAFRIAVNDELETLRILLDGVEQACSAGSAVGWLKRGGRVGIISFHSLEDRLVKRCFADLVRRGLATAAPARSVVASEEERTRNPRSRSARLRGIEVVGG